MIYNTGIYDMDNASDTNEYSHWKAMMYRCYGGKNNQAAYGRYEKVEVSEHFKLFSNFYKWCNLQDGFGKDGYELDKDVLGNGFLYSKDTCCFIPGEINRCFISLKINEGFYYHKASSKYMVRVRSAVGSRKYLGTYADELTARKVYLEHKQIEINRLVAKYESDLDKRVVVTLLSWSDNNP